jgi:hypothetical protein
VLGAVYLVLVALVFTTLSLADDGALRALLSTKREREPAPEIGALLAPLALAGGLYAPVMMMFWFAPVLVAWHSAGPAKALFYSFFACLLNWRAFLAYGAVTLLIMIAVPLAALSLPLLLLGAERAQMAPLVLPILILMLPTLLQLLRQLSDVFGGEQ